jgi:agmatine deiminase
MAINRWHFNSWGQKYPWKKDNEVGDKIARESKLAWFDPKIVLEGGAIDVNGRGTCLTTSSCLLNTNRNGGLSAEKMGGYLKSYLGIKNVIWLDGALKGDDTDGHVDNLARFVNPTTIVYISEDNKDDENYLGLKGIEETLKKASDCDGKPFAVIPLPMPRAIEYKNFRLPASYANFYIGNNVVLVPAFNDPNDRIAQEILKPCFPKKKIAPIDSRILLKGQGGVHCITQQQPKHSSSKCQYS